MKKTLLFILALMVGFAVVAQRATLKENLPTEKANFADRVDPLPVQSHVIGKEHKANVPAQYKATNNVSIVSIGTSANAYGYGYAGGQKSLLNANSDLNVVTNFHRMGGTLDPGGYSGDLGYDISFDGGWTWTNMVECYVASENAGGQYFIDAARYPNHGVYNPVGNTDPTNAYLAFFAPNLDGSNSSDSWGGYSYGIHKLGSPSNVDTTKHLLSSRPADNYWQYIPDGYAMVSANAEYWVADLNQNWSSGALVWLQEMIISHGVWDEAQEDFVLSQFKVPCPTQPGVGRPALQKVEFSPCGQFGYIAVLSDNGGVPISTDVSYYPVFWRTEDGGQTWTDDIAVAIAGPNGIGGVLNYLSDAEIAELYNPPLPSREEIEFTTAFDFDLSVDMYGNPHIAVVVGITGSSAYSIITGKSNVTGYAFTSSFLLSSMDRGEPGSWIGYELGRLVSFRGNFGDLTEDNRIQISRTPAGDKMFVGWLDTDTTVSSENNAPDIWARGVDIVNHTLTTNPAGQNRPNNVTFGSEGTFSAYFFAMGNEVLVHGDGSYTVPFTYQSMNPANPAQAVQFKYIQDFKYSDADFSIVGINENKISKVEFAEVSQTVPNPATTTARFNVTLNEPATVTVKVTNMMGQVVKTIPAASFQAGVNPVAIDVTDLTSGVYFYTVEAGKNAITKKMIVK